MEDNKLTPEQIGEVNTRVKEIIETFREGLCNSAVFDYNSYWTRGMFGDGEMSEACKHVYETKSRIVEMIDKETMLVCQDDRSLYYNAKRKVKDRVITTMMNILEPALVGRSRHDRYIERVVSIAEFAIGKGEELNEFSTRGKYLKKIK